MLVIDPNPASAVSETVTRVTLSITDSDTVPVSVKLSHSQSVQLL